MTDEERLDWLKNFYQTFSYPINEFNLFGVRFDRDSKNKDKINDYLGYWMDDDIFITKGTTKPGVQYVNNPIEGTKGVFTLVEGKHEKVWSLGFHGVDPNSGRSGLARHKALVNTKGVCKCTKGWRDINKNFVYDDKDVLVCGYYAVNFHNMGQINEAARVDIGKMSAGCQVVRSRKDFEKIIKKFEETENYKTNKKYATVDYVLFKSTEVPSGFVTAY